MGVTSMLMDVSSELVHSLLPVFLVTALHTSAASIGWITGLAESVASVTKVFSGVLSDRLGKRKPLAMSGYGLSALTKFAFPVASSVVWVAVAHTLDRFGKGIRGAPRDALLTEITPAERRGAAFGLRQALDSAGAVTGPVLALVLMWWLKEDVRAALWVAPVPAAVSVVALWWGVREPPTQVSPEKPLRWADLARFRRSYWAVVLLGAVFTLARFSEAFLLLRAQNTGLRTGLVPAVLVAMNVVYTLGAYPAGVAADRRHTRHLLLAGLATLVAADLVLAAARSPGQVIGGAGLWGLHMALTQGNLSKLVADAAPEGLRGTAFGVFNLVTGISTLFASAIAGFLWDGVGPEATFLAGAAFAALAAAGLAARRS
jgi:MFS family permease